MKEPTIHILFPFVDTAWGGGNQFLKALRDQFCKMGVYEEYPAKADVILFISYPFRHEQFFTKIYELRKQEKKTIIHRIAGPIHMGRGTDLLLDKIVYCFNSRFCDGSIFQSSWSKSQNKLSGMRSKNYETVIPNAPNPAIFYPNDIEENRKEDKKIKLVASSWSTNKRKGFDIYKFLDESLNFDKYEMFFYGRSPVEFENITSSPPISSASLAEELRGKDIFINASKYEACSNSLLEALHSGLPAVVRRNSGDSEIVGAAGLVFDGENDILQVIGEVAANLHKFKKEIRLPNLHEVATEYYEFCKNVHNETCGRKKKARLVDLLWIKTLVKMHSIGQYVRNKMNRLV